MASSSDESVVPDRDPLDPILTRRGLLAGAAGLAVAAAVPGAASASRLRRSASAGRSAATKSLTVGVVQNPGNLDPGGESIVVDIQINGSVFDSLFYKKAGSERIYPGLATSWTISPDVKTYTFKLRKGVKFHDGTPFNAAAVKATFDHIVDPATKSRAPGSHLTTYAGSKVIDDHTVKIMFKEPNASFMNEFSALGLISSPAAMKKYGSEYGLHPVGTGPFMFSNWVTGQSVTLVKNPHYNWASPMFSHKGPAHLDKLEFRILTDPSQRANALRTGELGLAEALNPQDASSILSDKKYTITGTTCVGIPYSIMMNVDKDPTSDLKVRQALIYATDQKTLVSTLFQNFFVPAHQYLTTITPGYDPKLNSMYTYDPAKAAKLLDAAGWKMASGGIREKNGTKLILNFINIDVLGFDQISQLLQAQFKAVGVGTTISTQSFQAGAATYNKGDQHLADFYDFELDSGVLAAVFGSDQIKAGFNWSHFSNAKADAIFAKANGEKNTAKRTALYKQVNRLFMEHAPAIPLYNLRSYWIGGSNVKGLKFSPGGFPYFYDVTV